MPEAQIPNAELAGLGWREKFLRLVSGDTHPAGLAAAVALGVFLGCSPLYGFQTVLVFALAALFRLNPIAAFLGSQVSFPPLGVAIVGAEVALGEWLRYGRWSIPKVGSTVALAQWLWRHALGSWLLGSLLLGSLLAGLAGLVVWGALVFWRSLRRT